MTQGGRCRGSSGCHLSLPPVSLSTPGGRLCSRGRWAAWGGRLEPSAQGWAEGPFRSIPLSGLCPERVVSGYTCALGCTGVLQHCGGWVAGNQAPAHRLAWLLPCLPWGG